MYFHLIEDPATGLLGYLLADTDDHEAVVIDPAPSQTELVLALLTERSLRLSHVLRTHVHRDDAARCNELCERTGARLIVGEGVAAPGLPPDKVLAVAHGARLVFGAEVVRVLATPGHTPACLSFLWRDRLFCGDVFDIGACAVGDGEADPGLLFDSLTRRLFLLAEQTLVFPAHSIKGRRVATMAELKQRYTQALHQSRDAFITDMALRRIVRPALGRAFEPKP